MSPRVDQKHRTREAILNAAKEISTSGETLTMSAVSKLARVSRATLYRYFPSEEALLTETPLRDLTASPDEFFSDSETGSIEDRVLKVQKNLTEIAERNPIQLRKLIRNHLQIAINSHDNPDMVTRSPSRIPYIERALEPFESSMSPDIYEKLFFSLCVLIGSESWIVLKDVCQLDVEEMNDVLGWAIKALLAEALAAEGDDGSREAERVIRLSDGKSSSNDI